MNRLRSTPWSFGKGPLRHAAQAGTLAAALLALALPRCVAQQPEQAPAAAQEPGAGAQVQTGTSSGLDTEARIQNLLADHEYFRIASQLKQLPPDQAALYRGVLANRSNDLKQSVSLLKPLLDKVSASGNLTEEKLLRKTLAQDYLRLGDWSQAAQAYQALETRLKGHLSQDEQDELELPVKLLPLAAADPPMTAEPCDPFQMQADQDPLGLLDIPVFVDARPHSWMLDPTLPFNLIDLSTAKEVGLKVSAQAVTIRTLTGRPMQVRVAVIPRFTIGGRLTLRNMTVFVYDDKDYYFPRSQYQVEGVLGYPALAALGSLTVTSDNTIYVRPASQVAAAPKDPPAARGARFFLDGDQIIVALGKPGAPGAQPDTASGDEEMNDARMYAIDAGGQQTYLTSRYYDEHSNDFAGKKMALFSVPGADTLPPEPAYTAETVPLTVGDTTIQLHFIPVLTQPLGSAALDDVYGVLGVDALQQLRSYTFDYRTMRFSVQPE